LICKSRIGINVLSNGMRKGTSNGYFTCMHLQTKDLEKIKKKTTIGFLSHICCVSNILNNVFFFFLLFVFGKNKLMILIRGGKQQIRGTCTRVWDTEASSDWSVAYPQSPPSPIQAHARMRLPRFDDTSHSPSYANIIGLFMHSSTRTKLVWNAFPYQISHQGRTHWDLIS
jgi:hypothetical protein